MVTTIQLNENVKSDLDRLKSGKDTYEDVIVKMIEKEKNDRKKIEELLEEGCREMYDDMLKMAKEWEGTLMDGLDKNEKWNEL